MGKSKDSLCKFEDVCVCHDDDYRHNCDECRWYRMIDSGYGRCTAIPEAPTVPWCKFTCVHFARRAHD